MKKNENISNEKELKRRISQLNSVRHKQEDELKYKVHTLVSSLKPVELINDTLSSLATNRRAKQTAAEAALQVGSRVVANKVVGRKGLKGLFSSWIVGGLIRRFVRKKFPDTFNGKDKEAEKNEEAKITLHKRESAEKE